MFSDDRDLSAADADLVRRDPALPGLSTLLSPGTFVERLRRACPDADLRGAEPTYVRYKPGTSCIAGFRLDVGGTKVHAYARAHRAGETGKLLKPVLGADGAHTPLGAAAVQLIDCAALVSVFPNDAALPALRLLSDSSALTAALGRMLADAPSGAAEVSAAPSVSTLAYKPERRYVGQLRIAGSPAAVLKFYTPAGYAVAQRNAKMVKSRGVLRVPQRLERSERHGIVALEWLPGRALSEFLADSQWQPDWEALARLGAGLAAFASKGRGRFEHRSGGAETRAAPLLEVARMVGVLWPPLASRAAALADRVASRLVDHPGRDRPVHGDFYAKQVLLDGASIAVVDWDEAGLDEPASDIGNFVAHMERHALAGHLPPDRVWPAAEALQSGFEAATGKSIAERVRVHTGARLLRIAAHPFRSREPDWPARTADILERVEQILGSQPGSASTPSPTPGGTAPPMLVAPTRRTQVPVTDSFNVSSDPAMPFARDALDPSTSLDLLAMALDAADLHGPFALRSIRVTRHKAGRRFLVEYEIEHRTRGPGEPAEPTLTVLGKVRAKGADERTHGLMQALWSGGFGPDSPDGISVPRPLGVIPELGMTLQLKAPGEPATRLLSRSGNAGTTLAARMADAIHKLHREGTHATRSHTLADELRILHDRLPRVAAERPEWTSRIERLLAACDDLATAIPPSRTAGIHRDFYPDQVLVDGDRLYLLDLDLYCRGDPALDVGNCIAHMTEQALRTVGDATAWRDREQAMEDRFVELTGDTRSAVRAHAALTLARHVYISTLFPERRHITERLLEVSQRRIEEAGHVT